MNFFATWLTCLGFIAFGVYFLYVADKQRRVSLSLGVRLVLLVKTLAVDSSGDEDRSHGDYIAKPDHARRKVGALFRRYAMKPGHEF